MKILIIADEVWNDRIFGNGVLTNWFTDFDADFAEIYCSPGLPCNKICTKYFRVTDMEMLKSFTGQHAGKRVDRMSTLADHMEPLHKGYYKTLKRISTWMHTPMMMIRDFIWLYGRYDKTGLQQFISEFNPDVIFCPRLATPKMLRLESLVHTMCNAPMVAFTGDDEASYQQYSLSPLFWIRRWYTHRMMARTVKIYSSYLMHSWQQAQEYRQMYGLNTGLLYKCATISNLHQQDINKTIQIVYAGNLYCNRWKTLARIGDALETINGNGPEHMVLHIYTTSHLTKKQKKILSSKRHIHLKGSVTPPQLLDVYAHADIALHVESFDTANRMATRHSFSTKITDMLASGCAVIAICWEKQTGFDYLCREDAAWCITNHSDILPTLQKIADNPSTIKEYQQKAIACATRNHSRETIHKCLTNCFEEAINRTKNR